jgi:hypothetical protein
MSLGMPMRVGMSVVQIGVMRVLVHERHMPVAMRVRLARGIAGHVFVPVMFVMRMAMFVLEGLVPMLVLMRLGEMQRDADRHQSARDDELSCQRLAEQGDRDQRADKRRRGEIGAGARRAEMAETEHE